MTSATVRPGSLADRLRRARVAAGHASQVGAGRACEAAGACHRVTYVRAENGASRPRPATLRAIVAALGLDLAATTPTGAYTP